MRRSSMKQKQKVWNTNLAAALLAVFFLNFCYKWFGSMPNVPNEINRTLAFIKVFLVNAISWWWKVFRLRWEKKAKIFSGSLTLCSVYHTWTAVLPKWTWDTQQIYIIIKLCSNMLWSWWLSGLKSIILYFLSCIYRPSMKVKSFAKFTVAHIWRAFPSGSHNLFLVRLLPYHKCVSTGYRANAW